MSSDQIRLVDKANELCWKMELYCQKEWSFTDGPVWVGLMVQLNDVIKVLDHLNGEDKE